ncbi:TPA: hypothetical protein ACWV6T_006186, partial [Salmonella enterica subsp. enterica serovar Muenchen]
GCVLPDGQEAQPVNKYISPCVGSMIAYPELRLYTLTETERKTARKVTWRGMYQRLLKVDPLKCILCGNKMCFSGLKRGLRLAELLACHERLAQMKMCG